MHIKALSTALLALSVAGLTTHATALNIKKSSKNTLNCLQGNLFNKHFSDFDAPTIGLAQDKRIKRYFTDISPKISPDYMDGGDAEEKTILKPRNKLKLYGMPIDALSYSSYSWNMGGLSIRYDVPLSADKVKAIIRKRSGKAVKRYPYRAHEGSDTFIGVKTAFNTDGDNYINHIIAIEPQSANHTKVECSIYGETR